MAHSVKCTNRICITILVVFLVIFLSACREETSTDQAGGGTEVGNPGRYEIAGYVQKGPFILGSQIDIEELDENLNPTGITFTTETNDDIGSFAITQEFSTSFVGITAQGYYFNEVSGSLSPSVLTLKAIVDLTVSEDVNVNILTTLSRYRIKYLVTNENMGFEAARAQAAAEILRIFHIPEAEIVNIANFEWMDISKAGSGNAMLLAVSAILQADNSVAELSELIAKINQDIQYDGTLDEASFISEIRMNTMAMDGLIIRSNLANRYNSLGMPVSIPDFEDYGDTDGDGVINKYDFTLLSPKGSVSDSKPVLDWSDSQMPDARYRVVLASDSNFTQVVEQADNLVDSSYEISSTLENNTTYHWKVLIKEGTGGTESEMVAPESFTLSLPMVTALNPSGLITDDTPELYWTGTSLADATYHVQISYDSNFNDIVWEISHITATSYAVSNKLPQEGSYFWRVFVVDKNGVEGSPSSVLNFTLDLTPPSGSLLINNGDITTSAETLNLNIIGEDVGGISAMYISMDGTFTDGEWEPFNSEKEIELSGYSNIEDAEIKVYLRLKDYVGNISDIFEQTIRLYRTFKSGVISADEIWSLEGSPYLINGDILIPSGVTLTIQPGVTVERVKCFFEIAVKGAIIAVGTEDTKINLNGAGTFDWEDSYGPLLNFIGTNLALSQLSHLNLKDAFPIIGFDCFDCSGSVNNIGTLMVSNVEVKDSSIGIFGSDPSIRLVMSNAKMTSVLIIAWENNVRIDLIDADVFESRIMSYSNNEDGLTVQNSNIYNTSFETFSGVSSKGLITVNSSIIRGSEITDKNRSIGSVNITNSYLFDTNLLGEKSTSSFSDGIWKNNRDNNISSGTTIWSGMSLIGDGFGNGIELASDQAGISTFTNTSLIGWSTGIQLSSTEDVTIQDSNFFQIQDYNVENLSYKGITANCNYWGATDEMLIKGLIYDFYDYSIRGVVAYSGYLTSPNIDAPISPPMDLDVTPGMGSIALEWSPNPESDTTGYIIYYGPDSEFPYDHAIDVGNTTAHTIENVAPGTYYVAVTAYDADYNLMNDDPDTIVNENQTHGNESWYSDEVMVEIQ